ncbi:MAG: hypothetical protein IJL63_04610 [Clostridia bacterium]|nr:hypothetical protein [Clostridia bacterium]
MYKRIVSLLIVIIILLSFTSCLGSKNSGESFSMPILSEPSSLDPQIAKSNSEKMIVLNCFEGLMRINKNGELENGVAESYEVSSDKLTYTFKLRSDAHWALFSGHKDVIGENYDTAFDINVYAEDFEFAFDRLFDDYINSPYKADFSCISSYKALDKHTFQIKLNSVYDGFLSLLTLPGAMPCDRQFYELTKGKYGLDAKYLLCNGPFNASKWIEGTSVKIVRNDDYNGVNKVEPLSVTFYINSSDEVVAEKMNNNTYDAAFLSADKYNNLPDPSDYTSEAINNTVYSLLFNLQNKYLSNKNIRLAISNCIDLTSAIESFKDSSQASGLVPPFCKIGNNAFNSSSSKGLITLNENAAKNYLEQGLLEVNASSVEIDIKCTEEFELPLKQLVQSMQKVLGVKFVVSIVSLPESELLAAVADGNYAVAFYPFTASTDRTEDFLTDVLESSALNYESEESNVIKENMKNAKGNPDGLRQACVAAERFIIGEAYIIPLIYQNSFFITNKDTQNIYFYSSPSNVIFINALKK